MEIFLFLTWLLQNSGLLAVSYETSPLILMVGADQYEHCLNYSLVIQYDLANDDLVNDTWTGDGILDDEGKSTYTWAIENDAGSKFNSDDRLYYDPLCKYIWNANEAFFKYQYA